MVTYRDILSGPDDNPGIHLLMYCVDVCFHAYDNCTEQILTPVTIKANQATFLLYIIYPFIRMLGYQVKPPRSPGPLLSDGQDPWHIWEDGGLGVFARM